jgi:hypothetical protein
MPATDMAEAMRRLGPTREGGDRRETPRRTEDAILHYARENLLGAVLKYWDELGEDDVVDPDLGEAVISYRTAEAAAREAGI